MDCVSTIIHEVDLTWALLATVGGLYPLARLLEHRRSQSGRDLFALILTFVAYPWAMAIMHLIPFDKGLVYAICIFSIPLYGVGVMRLLGYSDQVVTRFRQLSFATAAVLAAWAVSNPWHGQFALFDLPSPGQPNHQLDYQTPKLGAHLTLLYAAIIVLGTASATALRLLRSRFVWSYSFLGVVLPAVGLLAYFNTSLLNWFAQREINLYFLTTTLSLYYFAYLSRRGVVAAALPPAHGQIISLMPDPIVIINSIGNVVECNPAFESLIGSSAPGLLGQPLASLLPDTRFLSDQTSNRCLMTYDTGAGLKHLDMHITALSPKNGNPTSATCSRMILMRDVTKQTDAYKQVQKSEQQLHLVNAQLERLSTTDSLTGLRNRRYFKSQLEQALERINRDGRSFGLISLDLDHFKKINDCHGHQVGDQVLAQVALVLSQQCRATDTLARMGGEEFMVLLHDCNQSVLRRTTDRLRKAVASYPIATEPDTQLQVTASLGATIVDPGESMRDALQRVDGLLYSAKHQGRNQVVTL